MDVTAIFALIVVGLLIILSVPLLLALAAQTLANWATDDRVKEQPGGFPVHFPDQNGGRLRYAVLHHTEIATPHFDLLFERAPGSALMSWRSPVWPIVEAVQVERIVDHRQEYLEYEGEISNGRGRVRRVAGGYFVREAAGEDFVRVEMEGGRKLTFRRKDHSEIWTAEVAGPMALTGATV